MSPTSISFQKTTLIIMCIRRWFWVIWNGRCNNKINSISAWWHMPTFLFITTKCRIWIWRWRSERLFECIYFEVTVCIFSVEQWIRCQTVSFLSSYYPSQNTLYLQLQSSYRLQCTGFGVRMLRVLLNHPDFTSPAGASWKACQILGEHVSSASYMVWHQMYSITVV